VRKKGWFYALLLTVRAKEESITAKSCFVYLRLSQIEGENCRNSLLGGETSRFSAVSRGDATNKMLESERVCSKHFALKLSEQRGFGR